MSDFDFADQSDDELIETYYRLVAAKNGLEPYGLKIDPSEPWLAEALDECEMECARRCIDSREVGYDGS